jgi:hypothetical protein
VRFSFAPAVPGALARRSTQIMREAARREPVPLALSGARCSGSSRVFVVANLRPRAVAAGYFVERAALRTLARVPRN